MNKSISELLEKTMDQRSSVVESDVKSAQLLDGIDEDMNSYTIGPIVANGDPIGAVVIFSKDQSLGEVEHKAVETAAGFLARQMEQ